MILKIIAISCLINLLVVAEPIIMFRNKIGFDERNYIEWNESKKFIFRLITCCLCLGTWLSPIGLLIGIPIYLLPIIPVVAEIIYKIINK